MNIRRNERPTRDLGGAGHAGRRSFVIAARRGSELLFADRADPSRTLGGHQGGVIDFGLIGIGGREPAIASSNCSPLPK